MLPINNISLFFSDATVDIAMPSPCTESSHAISSVKAFRWRTRSDVFTPELEMDHPSETSLCTVEAKMKSRHIKLGRNSCLWLQSRSGLSSFGVVLMYYRVNFHVVHVRSALQYSAYKMYDLSNVKKIQKNSIFHPEMIRRPLF